MEANGYPKQFCVEKNIFIIAIPKQSIQETLTEVSNILTNRVVLF